MVMTLAQNRDAVLFHLPAFIADMAFTGGPLQFFVQPGAELSSSG